MRTILIAMGLLAVTIPQLSISGTINLQTYEVIEGIHVPFPHEPESLGEMRSEDFLEHGWRADRNNIGFTATVMLEAPDVPSDLDPAGLLFTFSANMARTMGGQILTREMITVSGYPALIIRISMDNNGIEMRSKTLMIYHNDKIHSWAIHYVVMENQDLAETVFSDGVNRIDVQ